MSHKEIYIKITKKEKHNDIVISGHTNRGRLSTKGMIYEIYNLIS